MEVPPIENAEPTPNSSDVEVPHVQDDPVPQFSDANGAGKCDHKLSAEETKGVLEIIASTGNFWHDWDELKSMLLFQLKQVVAEYPEARNSDDQLNASLGAYPQLVKSLEDALFSFIEGPPFTLQRLCEILLSARTIYPNLSKLALALEKNLLVTSTLTKTTDPYPPSIAQVADDSREQVQDAQPLPQPPSQSPHPPHSNSVENGGESMMGDRDEVMSEVDAVVDDGMTIDMETFEEIISSSEANPEPNNALS
ncbi:hypothetical protein BVRB_7g180020 [Beta vulgaris subsp. vulgaris]|uniref:Serine/threonine-protein phosphatase 4 regulatory subunit 2 n=1 Tax=Beta vulgaris subsp. vulgaris TaxID=3555 RepID=A0A0J8B6S1_BETVV|nr:uncharacterized protein LOC104908946 [Beta vulgaris subsp. vulgaris]KMS96959.1 hypothetical protein BVRB_7g180020 [Beta vulgaris subsp. vulgaris]